jgi:hypothetical protein
MNTPSGLLKHAAAQANCRILAAACAGDTHINEIPGTWGTAGSRDRRTYGRRRYDQRDLPMADVRDAVERPFDFRMSL